MSNGTDTPVTTESPAALAPAAAAPTKVPVRMGLAPQSIEEGWRLAQILAQSELVPKNFRGKPADVLVAIELGIEIGFAPMQALQSIAVINGRPSVWGDGFLALIMASPVYKDHEEYYEVDGQRQDFVTAEDLKKPTTAGVATFWRKDRATAVTRRFTIAQARQAQLLGKEGPWQTYPDRMLMMRARSWAGRDQFPDVLRGIRTMEEAIDEPEPIDVPAEPMQPRRASETAVTQAPNQLPTTAPVSAESVDANPLPGAGNSSAPNEPEASGQSTPPRQTRGLQITHTAFCRPKDGEPYYEIRAKQTSGSEYVFVTRNERLYKEAASFEGTDHLVAIGWRSRPVKGGPMPVSEMEQLTIDESAPASPLFR